MEQAWAGCDEDHAGPGSGASRLDARRLLAAEVSPSSRYPTAARAGAPKRGANHSPSHVAPLKLRPMGIKYYTHFVLTGDAGEDRGQEFSGIVEVNQSTERRFDTREIEALLARNFDLDSATVRLINWSRLQ